MRVRQRFQRSLLLAVLALVVTTMLVPYGTVEYVLRHAVCLKRAANFIDTVAPASELAHLLAFGLVGFAARLRWQNSRGWHLAGGCLLLAALLEVAQIWIPGRRAAVSHVLLDLLGGVAGFGLAWIFTYAWGSDSVPEP